MVGRVNCVTAWLTAPGVTAGSGREDWAIATEKANVAARAAVTCDRNVRASPFLPPPFARTDQAGTRPFAWRVRGAPSNPGTAWPSGVNPLGHCEARPGTPGCRSSCCISADHKTYTVLHSFAGSDGANPFAGLAAVGDRMPEYLSSGPDGLMSGPHRQPGTAVNAPDKRPSVPVTPRSPIVASCGGPPLGAWMKGPRPDLRQRGRG